MSVIHISLVNLLSTRISNIGFNATWVAKRSMPKELPVATITFQHINEIHIEMLPGQWQDINFYLKSPNNLGYLKLAINMENIQFDNLPLLKIGRKEVK